MLFVSFQLKDTIVKLEYISFLFFNCESYHSSIFHKEQSSIHLFFVKKFRVCGKKTSTVSFLKNRNYNIATYTESDFFCITFVDLGRAKINCALKRKEKLPQKNNAQRIEILQKRVNRIVDKSYYNIYRIYRTYFKKLKLLKFQDNHLMHLD